MRTSSGVLCSGIRLQKEVHRSCSKIQWIVVQVNCRWERKNGSAEEGSDLHHIGISRYFFGWCRLNLKKMESIWSEVILYATFVVNLGQQRSRMLATLFKDERCQQLPAYGILEKMYVLYLQKCNENCQHSNRGFSYSLIRPIRLMQWTVTTINTQGSHSTWKTFKTWKNDSKFSSHRNMEI